MTWSAGEVARACAAELAANEVVFLGPGLPHQIREHLSGSGVIAIDASGLVGVGPAPRGREKSIHPAADDELVTLIAGGAIVSPIRAAAMLRRGWIDVGVVEAGQADATGSLASMPGEPSSGQLREILLGAGRLIACLRHQLPDGSPALLRQLPADDAILERASVDLVITDLGTFRPTGERFQLLKSAPGLDLADLQDRTEAPIEDCRHVARVETDKESPEDPSAEDDDLLASAAPSD